MLEIMLALPGVGLIYVCAFALMDGLENPQGAYIGIGIGILNLIFVIWIAYQRQKAWDEEWEDW